MIAPPTSSQWITFALSIVGFHIFHGLGITLGYHRLLSHRSFKVPIWIEYILVLSAYTCFEGSPIFWVSNHRLHHRYSDKLGDPHSPVDGLWHCFLGWMVKPKVEVSEEELHQLCPDLYRDPLYRMLHPDGWKGATGIMCLFVGIVYRALVLVFFGPIVFWGNVCGSVLAFASPLLVNSVCHLPRFGYQTYEAGDQSRNVWFIAILALGEGWHNNHHAFPQSARHGLQAQEFDLSWLVIRLLQGLGLASNVRLARQPQEEKRKIHIA